MQNQMTLTALPDIPMIQKGDDLSIIIMEGLRKANIVLKDGDILALAQKIVSKSEGRMIDLDSVIPSARAKELALYLNKNESLVELILSESSEIVRMTEGDPKQNKEGLIIVRHRLGYISANAGIDMSNVPHEAKRERALLLPIDPDASCEKIRAILQKNTGAKVGILINDSHGRAFRLGTIGVALGIAGIPGIQSLVGRPDLFKRELKTTVVGFADEVSSAASIVMGQSNEGMPIIHIRGVSFEPRNGSAQELIREKQQDLFL